MKKTLFALLALLIFAGALVITCPNKQKHTDTIAQIILSTMDNSNKGDGDQIGNIVRNSIKGALNTVITIDNYYIFSIGRMNYAGSNKKISIGAMGYVHLLNKENLFGKKGK